MIFRKYRDSFFKDEKNSLDVRTHHIRRSTDNALQLDVVNLPEKPEFVHVL
jgi:hypothetical protein